MEGLWMIKCIQSNGIMRVRNKLTIDTLDFIMSSEMKKNAMWRIITREM